ncbi:MAG: hypothetical protein ACTSVM_01490 [Candidatus Ranarchaeia archaeon]
MEESWVTDWWLGTGFYAGLIGGILDAILFYLLMKSPQLQA